MNRPVGVTVLAWISLIRGLFGLAFWLGIGGLSTILAGAPGLAALLGFAGVAWAFFNIFAPLFHLLWAYGAFTLRRWAWWLGILGPALALLGAAWAILRNAPVATTLFGVAIPLVIFVYLLQPRVRQAFRR